MSIAIECNGIGILAHSIRRELRDLISRYPWIRRSLRIVILTHRKLLIVIDNVVENNVAVKLITEILDRHNIKYTLHMQAPLNT